jgi:hypothetical protein
MIATRSSLAPLNTAVHETAETPIMSIRSIFAVRRQAPASSHPSVGTPLEEIRQALHLCIQDCRGMAAQRVVYKINLAETAADLWLLRSDLHQCISRTHDQSEAARRINELLDTFRGWIPSAQLTRI